MAEKFSYLNNIYLDFHGIDKKKFDEDLLSPYSQGKNAVFVGNSYLDFNFLEIASQAFPQVQFHIIGPFKKLNNSKNILFHGEMPFTETVPFIKHADVGLVCRKYKEDFEMLSDSLKVLQYAYAGLPMVMPDYLDSSRNNVYFYRPGCVETIRQ